MHAHRGSLTEFVICAYGMRWAFRLPYYEEIIIFRWHETRVSYAAKCYFFTPDADARPPRVLIVVVVVIIIISNGNPKQQTFCEDTLFCLNFVVGKECIARRVRITFEEGGSNCLQLAHVFVCTP